MRGVMTFEMSDELLQAFTQWIRDFDSKHRSCTFNIFAETKHNAEAMKQIFEGINPGFPFVGAWKIRDEK